MSATGVAAGDPAAVTSVTCLLFLAQVECERSETFLPLILQLSDPTKDFIAQAVDSLREDPRLKDLPADPAVEFLHTEHHIREELENEVARQRTLLSERESMMKSLEGRVNELQSLLHISEAKESELISERNQFAEEVAQLRSDLAAVHSERDRLAAQVKDLKAIQSDEPESVQNSLDVYKRNLVLLEQRVKLLESTIVDKDSEIAKITNQLSQARRDDHRVQGLERDLNVANENLTISNTRIQTLQEENERREKEIVQYAMTGGALGGEVRDRVIKTLQEQLQVRDEEIQFYRADRLDSHEEQKKGERLLISAIHAIGLKYHEEMVRRFEESPPPEQVDQERVLSPSDDFYAQEYKAN